MLLAHRRIRRILAQIPQLLRIIQQIKQLRPKAVVRQVFPALAAHHGHPATIDRLAQTLPRRRLERIVVFADCIAAPVRIFAVQKRD
ncbi:hypothetical protein D3C81_1425300 [compost metagenome]